MIRSKGDAALFGGFGTNDMKRKMGVAANRPLADFLPTLTIKAKDFAAELTSHNVIEKDLKGDTSISKEHIDNNSAVRKMLGERGVKPEQLPAAEDVKKLQRKLKTERENLQRAVKRKVDLPPLTAGHWFCNWYAGIYKCMVLSYSFTGQILFTDSYKQKPCLSVIMAGYLSTLDQRSLTSL
jgi:hypothetical protein